MIYPPEFPQVKYRTLMLEILSILSGRALFPNEAPSSKLPIVWAAFLEAVNAGSCLFLPSNEVSFDSAIALLFFSFGDLADRSNEQKQGKSFYFTADLIENRLIIHSVYGGLV
jgi:hypothetical protein